MKSSSFVAGASLLAAAVAGALLGPRITTTAQAQDGKEVTLVGKIVELHSFMLHPGNLSPVQGEHEQRLAREGEPLGLRSGSACYVLIFPESGAASYHKTAVNAVGKTEVKVQGREYVQCGCKTIEITEVGVMKD